jgi:hypothetical protein
LEPRETLGQLEPLALKDLKDQRAIRETLATLALKDLLALKG